MLRSNVEKTVGNIVSLVSVSVSIFLSLYLCLCLCLSHYLSLSLSLSLYLFLLLSPLLLSLSISPSRSLSPSFRPTFWCSVACPYRPIVSVLLEISHINLSQRVQTVDTMQSGQGNRLNFQWTSTDVSKRAEKRLQSSALSATGNPAAETAFSPSVPQAILQPKRPTRREGSAVQHASPPSA